MERPTPVLDAQRLTAGVLGVFGAVMTLLAALGVTVNDGAAQAIVGVLTGLGTVLAVLLPLRQAKAGAALVTPLSDPQDNAGRALVPAGPPLD